MITLSRIETAAAAARIAGLYVKSIRLAALYTPAPVVAVIVWSMPMMADAASLQGGTETALVRPSNTCVALGTGAAANIEPQVLSAAWTLGAWDVRRIESAPITDPAQWHEARHGLVSGFGVGGHEVKIRGYPLTDGQGAEAAVAQAAARSGHVSWSFVPLALAHPVTRARWADKDSTIANDCTRGARGIRAQPLAGRQVPGTGHEHIYRLGRGPHGNRNKAAKERRSPHRAD